MQITNSWIKIEITAPEELVDAISSFLDDIGVAGCYQENFVDGEDGDFFASPAVERLIVHIPQDLRSEKKIAQLERYLAELKELFPQLMALSASHSTVENPDWNEAWKKYFKPLRIGRNIVIKPSWERFIPQADDILVEIDPGMAFGTGQHASSRLCLEELEVLLTSQQPPWRMLDVGTGTGILSIYAAKAGVGEILAIDLDQDAVTIAQENARLNGIRQQISFRVQTLEEVSGDFNLIVANLTTKTLIDNRHRLLNALINGGFLILSGVIAEHGDDIERAFKINPENLCRKRMANGWVCYALQQRK
ncbi:MAG: 50S ribosomal protein L11 methyltransferase [Deltaproteobacteria bacterium]|nr:50S ribosomal protein L11 methyltransferase [Deltaproteobacteria bacterium]